MLRLLAHGKINWTLEVTGVREDGYHLLDMLMQSVELADELTLEPADGLSMALADAPGLTCGDDNLVMRAAILLRQTFHVSSGAKLTLKKGLPVGAGMGGGSADAAATLVGLNRLWELHAPLAQLSALGLSLGADVPFCLVGGACQVSGVGEKIAPVACALQPYLVIAQPAAGLSTARVYAACPAPTSDGAHTAAAVQALAKGDISELRRHMVNDLYAPAQRLLPVLEVLAQQLSACRAEAVLMTGSGSAVYGVFHDAQAAEACRALLSEMVPFVRVTRLSGTGVTILL